MAQPMQASGWVPSDTFALRLGMIRAELKLTIEEAAKRCGLKTATWATWEQGVRPRDFQSVVNRIHQNLGADREWLTWGGVLEPQNLKKINGIDQGECGIPGQMSIDELLKSLTKPDRHLAVVSDVEGQMSIDEIVPENSPPPVLRLVPPLETVE